MPIGSALPRAGHRRRSACGYPSFGQTSRRVDRAVPVDLRGATVGEAQPLTPGRLHRKLTRLADSPPRIRNCFRQRFVRRNSCVDWATRSTT